MAPSLRGGSHGQQQRNKEGERQKVGYAQVPPESTNKKPERETRQQQSCHRLEEEET
jgi:hypothetical protein